MLDDPVSPILPRKQGEARRVAAAAYEFRGCVVCGLTLQSGIMVAHLDQNGGNNAPDNLAYLCGTHHWMYDAGLYPIAAIRLLRTHWQTTGGKPDHKTTHEDSWCGRRENTKAEGIGAEGRRDAPSKSATARSA